MDNNLNGMLMVLLISRERKKRMIRKYGETCVEEAIETWFVTEDGCDSDGDMFISITQKGEDYLRMGYNSWIALSKD